MLEKVTAIKRFEYSPLSRELKKQIDIAKKQYQRLDTLCEFDETINIHDKKQTLKKCNKSYLINNSNHSFYKYCRDIKKFDNLSLKSKYSILAEFFNDFGKLTELKTQKEKKKKKPMCMIQFQNYIMTCWKYILINTMIYQM